MNFSLQTTMNAVLAPIIATQMLIVQIMMDLSLVLVKLDILEMESFVMVN